MTEKLIVIIGTHYREREFIINKLVNETGLPRRRFIDSGNDPHRVKGIRNQYYYDIGLSPNSSENERKMHEEVFIELHVGNNTEFIAGKSL